MTIKASDSNLPPKKRKQTGITCTVHAMNGDGAGDVGGDVGEKKVTILVHTDVKKILSTVKDKFPEYSKSVKNLDYFTNSIIAKTR